MPTCIFGDEHTKQNTSNVSDLVIKIFRHAIGVKKIQTKATILSMFDIP